MAKQRLTIDQYVDGVSRGDRTILSQAITLIESNAEKHMDTAQEVLRQLMGIVKKTIRIGITGVPGAGKSTFIEAFGSFLCESGKSVAVLAVDPSSSISRGSIMADKTRMERLSRHPNAFIRPSPSSGALGGVARKTRETMLLCEAAGFEVIIVETVGVGQSETLVSTMVDFFLLITLTGAGDELQSIKKGVIELADAILINKADGDNKIAADRMKAEFNQALRYMSHPAPGWETKAYCCSALKETGVDEIWRIITDFQNQALKSGYFAKKRQNQAIEWLNDVVINKINSEFFHHPRIIELLPKLRDSVVAGTIPVTTAAKHLLDAFYQNGD